MNSWNTSKEDEMNITRGHYRLLMAIQKAERTYKDAMNRREQRSNQRNLQAVFDAYARLVVLRSKLPDGHPSKDGES